MQFHKERYEKIFDKMPEGSPWSWFKWSQIKRVYSQQMNYLFLIFPLILIGGSVYGGYKIYNYKRFLHTKNPIYLAKAGKLEGFNQSIVFAYLMFAGIFFGCTQIYLLRLEQMKTKIRRNNHFLKQSAYSGYLDTCKDLGQIYRKRKEELRKLNS